MADNWKHSEKESDMKRSSHEGTIQASDVGEGGSVWSSVKKALVLVTTSSVVLLALRNTITYHVQHFWGASGNFWQYQWDNILDFFDHDPFKVMVYGPTFGSYLIYWVVGGLFTIMDLTKMPSFLRPYKIQPGTNEPIFLRDAFKTFLYVSFNQLVAGLAFSIMCYNLQSWRGYDQSPQLPTFHWVLFELSICVLMVELGFYYAHRLFHHRYLYKHIHKIHHEWQSPIAIAALYAHPLEHIIANMAPVLLGPFILGSHPGTTLLWTCLATLNTLNAHSGYHLPFFPSNEGHDYHHLKFNQCFGFLGILDHLHGTDNKFRASKNYSRHITMLTLVPALQMFPDENPNAKTIKGKEC